MANNNDNDADGNGWDTSWNVTPFGEAILGQFNSLSSIR